MSTFRRLATTAALVGGVGMLVYGKPAEASFRPFLRQWLQERLSERNATGGTDALSSFLDWGQKQLDVVTAASLCELAEPEFSDLGVCVVVTVRFPGQDALYFLGAGGQWFAVPASVIENCK